MFLVAIKCVYALDLASESIHLLVVEENLKKKNVVNKPGYLLSLSKHLCDIKKYLECDTANLE